MRFRLGSVALLAVAMSSSLLAQPASAADANKPAVTGTMQIDFTTRMAQNQEEGAPKKGVKDYYPFDLTVNPDSKYATKFAGKITRQPRITQLKVRTIQWPQLEFEGINIEVPKAPGAAGTVGTLVGVISVDEKTGAFNLNNQNRQLRIDITKGRTFTDNFGGVFYGKAEDKSSLSITSIKRSVGGKEVEVKFQADPIKFQQTKLAKGPFPTAYPTTVVSGELSYDRETANYYARNLTFRYSGADNKEVTDTVSGTIKWVEDPARKQNGKGRYEFNLRFNEEQNHKGGDDAQFAGKNDDDLFFAVDNSIPTLLGNIEYQDTMNGETVTQSKVTYKLEQNKLNDTQVMNFAKLWLLVTGPANDE